MPDDKNRNRQIQVKFFVSEKELAAIKQRMTKFGADNLSAYLRTMARLHPRGRAAKSGTGMTEIMPVPRNLILLSYQQGGFAVLFFKCRQSCRQCIELHGESAERGRESPFCVQSELIQECF